ncbi:MAG TPA: tetratricopeptide repeat protein [Acidobacteriaceae bacterium]|jgi:tetratricopeptide (TPR) repeat protein|nr:tetratricopeptide repeat protein [Acidobacteriaceae bacterium]
MRIRSYSAAALALAVAFFSASPVRGASAEALPQAASSIALETMPPELRGDLYMARGQYVQAVDAYRQVSPMSAVVWNKLGIAWHHLSAVDEAKRDYERALLIRPNYAEAINNLGATYFEAKNYKKAIKLYRHALELMPASAAIAANLGTAYFARGKYKPGIVAYRKAFELDPSVFSDPAMTVRGGTTSADRARQDYCLAELFAQAGMKETAIDYLRRSFDEGFHDRNRLMQDAVFAQLRKTADFAHLMADQKLKQ